MVTYNFVCAGLPGPQKQSTARYKVTLQLPHLQDRHWQRPSLALLQQLTRGMVVCWKKAPWPAVYGVRSQPGPMRAAYEYG